MLIQVVYTRLRPLAFLCVVLVVAGCVKPPPEPDRQQLPEPPVPLPAESQLQAIDAERQQRYFDAVSFWKEAEHLVAARLAELSQAMQDRAANHARRGVVFYNARNEAEAVEEFVEALRYNPANQLALDYLENRFEAGRPLAYIVKPNDDFKHIARKVYGSPFYAFMIEHFSDAGPEEALAVGQTIRMAGLGSFYSEALRDYKTNIVVARKYFKEHNFEQALERGREILGNHPGDEEASYIINMSLLALADQKIEQEEYAAAIEHLSEVDPAFRKVSERILQVRELQKNRQSEDRLLVNNILLQRGRELYEQKKFIEARAVLRQVDGDVAGRGPLLAAVTEQLKALAESHYKDGVQLFVEEDLTGAIAEWEKTLLFDPGHKQAATSLIKARELLEKVEELNQPPGGLNQ